MKPPCGCSHLRSRHGSACRDCLCPSYHPDSRVEVAEVNGRWLLRLPEHRAYRHGWATWERERIAAMRAQLEPGDVVYDIGAEEGDLSALWSSWGCRTVLVEANPLLWPWIRLTFEANGLTAAGWWAGFAAGCDWHVDDDVRRLGRGGWPACAYVDDPAPEPGFVTPHEYADQIPGRTVDALAAELDPPDVLTIDVEGSEIGVLRGAVGTLETVRPLVFCSVHPSFIRHRGENPDDLFGFMAAVGYDASHIATDHEEHWCFTPR